MSGSRRQLVCHRCGVRFTPVAPGRPLGVPTCPDCWAWRHLRRHSELGRYAVETVTMAVRAAHPEWPFHQAYHRALHLIRRALTHGEAALPGVRVRRQDPDIPSVAVWVGEEFRGVAAVPGTAQED